MTGTHETKDQGTGMTQGHALDLKLPIGGLIGGYGALLTVYGLLTPKAMYGISLGINLNLIWGILMVLIGGAFLFAAFVKRSRTGKG